RGFLLSTSFTMWAGPWSGAITDLAPAGSAEVTQYGPATMPNGQANPLSTRERFVRLDCATALPECFATRDEQVQAPSIKASGLRLGKRVTLGGGRELELAGNVFNLLNEGNYTQFNYSGANEKFNSNFLQMRNQQPARSFQTMAVLRF